MPKTKKSLVKNQLKINKLVCHQFLPNDGCNRYQSNQIYRLINNIWYQFLSIIDKNWYQILLLYYEFKRMICIILIHPT